MKLASPSPYGWSRVTEPQRIPEDPERRRTAPLAAGLKDRVAGLMTAVDRGMTEALAPHDLIPLEFRLLHFCMEMGECTATQIAEILPTDPSRISRLVHGLVQRGLLRRRRLTSDRRIVMLRLTGDGVELTRRLEQRVHDFYDALTEGIGEEELGAFMSSSLRMMENYDATKEGPP